MVGLARVNGDDKLVRGLSDTMVESTVNVLISNVVVTEGNSGVVVTATVGVISGSKLLSVITSIILVEKLVMDTTSDDGVLDCISVNAIVVSKANCVVIAEDVMDKLLIGSGILVDVTSTLSIVEVTNDTKNVSVVSKLLRILLDIIIPVDCITVGTITLVMSAGSDEGGVVIVDKLLMVTMSVNNTVELVIG